MIPDRDSTSGGRLPGWLPWTLVLVLLIVAAAVWLGRGRLFGPAGGAGADAAPGADLHGESATAGAGDAAPATGSDAAAQRWQQILGRGPGDALELGPVEADACSAVGRDLAALCVLLARREGRGDSAASVCDDLRDAARRLAARPPQASGEGAAPELMVGNVVHVARVLGPEGAARWGRLAAASADDAELVSWVLYRYVRSRAACEPGHPLAASGAAGDYAVALLGTVGGSAYLARRMPAQAELARFYALALIDETNAGERHGLDPRPHVARAKAALDGLTLIHRAEYLRHLDSIERRWRER